MYFKTTSVSRDIYLNIAKETSKNKTSDDLKSWGISREVKFYTKILALVLQKQRNKKSVKQ